MRAFRSSSASRWSRRADGRVADALQCVMQRLRNDDTVNPEVIEALGQYGPEHRTMVAPQLRSLIEASSPPRRADHRYLGRRPPRRRRVDGWVAQGGARGGFGRSHDGRRCPRPHWTAAVPALETVAKQHPIDYMRDLAQRRMELI